jgi:tetratricopeptide (TPR) repeat protein
MRTLVTCALLLAFAGPLRANEPSPAARAIAEAESEIAKDGARLEPYNALALALARRARETGDPSLYARAGDALKKSLELAPDNLEARKLEAWLLLGRHEFAEALKLAKELNRRAADDPMVYGFIVDASTELGDYKEAEEAAQWMLDLGRSSVPGLTRAAYLREMFGDVEGALELMASAYGKIDPTQVEDRAWVLTHVAHLDLLIGNVDGAEQALEEALRLFPGYHYTLANLARVRTMQGRYDDAVELLGERSRAAPHPENLFDLGMALHRAGREEEARRVFGDFEASARKEMNGADNANRELVSYYADYAEKPAEALEIAGREISRRRDIRTLDAYGWALYRAGKAAEARRAIESALAVGVCDPGIFYHAGAVAASQKDDVSARRYLKRSLELNARSEVAAEVRALLARLPAEAPAER